MGIVPVLEIEEEKYTKEDLQNMNFEQLKMLVAFCETEEQIKTVIKWSGNGILESHCIARGLI